MLKKVNIKDEVNSVDGLYIYKKIGTLNSHVLSVVQVENRTLDFHVHEKSDELFYVIEGSFQLELEDGLLTLNEGEFVIVPKGTKHRPVVKSLTKFLMIELEGTLNKENSGDLYED
ncbi:MAG TPA: cupin domain-containing protein [Spirochaetota bacterium]|jgi:mannose-6-phosphate isomerase-like protein (cupin superfamily)|nr:MAG: 3-hydroxyanthranilate 3,4-dioxygenase [Spirochaetes bacterium ADurb.Bin218]HOK03463.1 cupin domain-containing protein [Spirochaetota bacterium]HOK93794.1 cupin domain-containing protein [Spirochaetota bacterium]HPP96311.1 cupin domain-containing protein [Spirochaetota bacterium]HRS64115.1 cupin domain-containing protein [Spirochaetota bacterium]